MPVEIKHQSFSDCEVLDIQGVKQGRGNPMNTVRLKFDNLYNLKEFQNELNNMFPENIKLDKKFTEPEEEGLYLTTTGTLLSKDTEGDWLKIIKKLGVDAFPLTHVNVTPIYK